MSSFRIYTLFCLKKIAVSVCAYFLDVVMGVESEGYRVMYKCGLVFVPLYVYFIIPFFSGIMCKTWRDLAWHGIDFHVIVALSYCLLGNTLFIRDYNLERTYCKLCNVLPCRSIRGMWLLQPICRLYQNRSSEGYSFQRLFCYWLVFRWYSLVYCSGKVALVP